MAGKYDECIANVAKYLKGQVTESEVAQVIADIERRLNKKRGQARALDYKTITEEAQGVVDEYIRLINVERKSKAQQIRARVARRKSMDKMIDAGASPDDIIQADTVGVTKNMREGKLSVAARQKALANRWLGGMMADLERGDLLEAAIKGKMDNDIAVEMWELSSKGGQPGVTGNKHAREIAEVFHKYQKLGVKQLNELGANIGDVDGYVTRQMHDTLKIRKVSEAEWIDHILPLLDVDRTFKDVDDPRAFLAEVYRNLSTGRHMKQPSGDAQFTPTYRGMGNLARKISQSRVLHFKDAKNWMAYNKRFGSTDLLSSIVNGIEHSAHNVELLKRYGTNPRAAFEADIDYLRRRYRGKEGAKKLEGKPLGQLVAQFEEVDGTSRIAQDVRLSNIGSTTRGWMNLTSLGGVLISSFSDVPLRAAAVRHQGRNMLSGYHESLTSITDGAAFALASKEERAEFFELMAMGFDGLIGDVSGRFSSVDNMPGLMSKMMQKFFKYNGLNWWTDAHRRGMGKSIARHMSMESKKGFGELHEKFQRLLTDYGIEAAEWDVIRRAGVKMMDGKEYITGDAMRFVDDKYVVRYLGKLDASRKEIDAAKEELAARVSTYMSDFTDSGVVTAGARERAILNLQTVKGTPIGEFVRTFMQFKSFAVTVFTRVFGREWQNLRTHGDVVGLAHLMLMSTGFGYMSMSLKDAAKGLTPKEPIDKDGNLNVKVLTAAMAQGGGLGIFGDFMFAEYNRYGGGMLETLAGPAVGKVSGATRLARDLAEGKDVAARTFNGAIGMVPGNNLFYARSALNYLLLYGIQEQLNPGYLRRMERRVRKDYGQKFFYPPRQNANMF